MLTISLIRVVNRNSERASQTTMRRRANSSAARRTVAFRAPRDSAALNGAIAERRMNTVPWYVSHP